MTHTAFLDSRSKKTLYFTALTLILVVGKYVMDVARYLEDDPLTVTGPMTEEIFNVQIGESFVFERTICTEKDILISTKRAFHSISTGKVYMLENVQYLAEFKHGHCYIAQFETALPSKIPPGVYEYRPVLTYNINTKFSMTKRAPAIIINVMPVDHQSLLTPHPREPPLPSPAQFPVPHEVLPNTFYPTIKESPNA